MIFECLVICPPELAAVDFFKQLLWQALTDNLNDVELDQVSGAVQITHLRHCPPKQDGNGNVFQRCICGFTVEMDNDTQYIDRVIDDFCTAVESAEGVDHLLKFFDDYLLKQNLQFMRQIFELEMKLRKVLLFIYLFAYEDGYYSLLREETIEIVKKDGQKPTENELHKQRENEFFHLLFSQYISLNNRRLPKQAGELIALLCDAENFEALQQKLNRRPIPEERDADFLASLKSLLDPIEKLRNSVAHNRAPLKTVVEQFHIAADDLNQRLDEFLADFVPNESLDLQQPSTALQRLTEGF